MQAQALRADTDGRQDFAGEVGGDDGVVITNLVMTFPQLSHADKNTVGPCGKALHDEKGVHPSGAHDANGADVGRILEAGHPRRVRRGIAAPVAQEPQNFRHKGGHGLQVLPSKARIWAKICSLVKQP